MVRFSWSEGLLAEAIPSGEACGTGLLAGRCLLAIDLLRKRMVKALVVGASMERLSSCDGALDRAKTGTARRAKMVYES